MLTTITREVPISDEKVIDEYVTIPVTKVVTVTHTQTINSSITTKINSIIITRLHTIYATHYITKHVTVPVTRITSYIKTIITSKTIKIGEKPGTVSSGSEKISLPGTVNVVKKIPVTPPKRASESLTPKRTIGVYR